MEQPSFFRFPISDVLIASTAAKLFYDETKHFPKPVLDVCGDHHQEMLAMWVYGFKAALKKVEEFQRDFYEKMNFEEIN